MTGHFPVVIDACVLVNAPVRDTLLRLAEKGLYLPRWSEQIIGELALTLDQKLAVSEEKVRRLIEELKNHFSDACVEGYEPLIHNMTNHEGDRHVLAAAVRCGAEVITTFNVKHFPDNALEPWDIELRSPDDFLVDSISLESASCNPHPP